MKNILWILSASVVFTLSSCISTAQFNNAEDDVYYSPKASNRKQPVMIPEVNVDEIIKQNPPQYGQPTNRVDDVTPNPNAAEGYRAYRAQQDSLYNQDPSLSGYYINPNLPNSETDETARRNKRWFRRSAYNQNYWNNNNWNYGLGWNSFYGPGLTLGYSNFGYNNWGCNNYWGNNWGWNYGYNNWGYAPYGYNNWNNYCGWNTGFGNPYYNNFWGYPGYGYGYGGYYSPGYYYDNNNNNSGGGNAGNQPISRPRPSVGSPSTPPPTNSGGQTGGGRSYVAPQPGNDQPQQGATPNNGRAYTPPNYTPTNGQRLENVNGRVIYTRPQEVTRPEPAQNPGNAAPGFQRTPDNNKQPSRDAQRPSYNDSRSNAPAPQMNSGNNGGRSSGGSTGGRSGSGGSSGSSSGGRRK